MKTTNSIVINVPAQNIWKVLAEDFDKVGDWLSQVPKSYRKEEDTDVPDSPMSGRVCELSTKANGPIADETITGYDEINKVLKIRVVPKNRSIPVKENNAVVSLTSVDPYTTKVTWASDFTMSLKGKLLSFMIRPLIKKSFNELLEELKYFVERGKPHPRKLKKMQHP